MLLYDRLRLHLHHFKNKGGNCHDFDRTLSDAAVFDATSVLPLMDVETSESSDFGISRRPPNPITWVEWWDNSPVAGSESSDQIGCLITPVPPSLVDHIFKSCGPRTDMRTNQLQSLDHKDYDEFYVSISFRFFNKPLHRLAAIANPTLWMGSDRMAKLVNCTLGDIGPSKAGDQMYGLPSIRVQHDGEGFGTEFLPWPAFMTFALLHCKNICTETTAAQPQKARESRHGLPPRSEFKTLRLKVTGDIKPHSPGNGDQTDRNMRFHLCRGHFKNLQHERYKNKGWHWWPSHWKGSKDLGTIKKTYETVL